jgi:Ca-activated chloride channel family protein
MRNDRRTNVQQWTGGGGRRKLGVTFALIVGAVVAIVLMQRQGGLDFGFGGELDYDEAASRLDRLVQDVDWSEELVQRKANVSLGQKADLKDSLPPIGQFAFAVNPPVAFNDVAVEIFVSTEKSGSGTDGWMADVARDFNVADVRLSGGKIARVKIRKIASGTGYEFIAARKYLPQAFSPSNHLWIRMAEAHGITMTPVREKTVVNLAGVVMKNAVADKLKSTRGGVDIKSLIDSVLQGEMAMGYTNPFASSTGLNFLVSVLATFADGDEGKMLSPEVVSAFEAFQRGVPFVGETTLQLRESVRNDGSLDAFVMEYQTFVKTAELQSGYQFAPFGFAHDNPLYAVGDVTPEQKEVLEKFAAFSEQAKYRNLGGEYGFNPAQTLEQPYAVPAGDVLIRAQEVWKTKKDAGRSIAAVFLCDVSGSMAGTRIQGVRQALIDGADFIAENNSIGLVFFDDRVRVVLPVRKFNLNHQAAFIAAAEDMVSGGGTAMYDGIAVALKLLVKAKEADPTVKPVLFVLSDGETNDGMGFADMEAVVKGLRIPIYTIGYEADFDELRRVSGLVEAATINASEGEIRYKIGSLLNAQM